MTSEPLSLSLPLSQAGRKTYAVVSGCSTSHALASELVESNDGHEEIIKVYLKGKSGDKMIHEKNINQLKSEVQYIQEVGTPSSCEMAYVISLNLTFWVSLLLCVLIISPFYSFQNSQVIFVKCQIPFLTLPLINKHLLNTMSLALAPPILARIAGFTSAAFPNHPDTCLYMTNYTSYSP